jgi:hypothetical protein
MKKLVVFLAALGLSAGGLIGLSMSPASAHWDLGAYFACANGAPSSAVVTPATMIHAHPLTMGSGWVNYGCYSVAINGQCVRWEVLSFSDGTVWGPLDGSISYSTCPPM